MEDDRDILGKADALLRRHVPPRSSATDGADVPVLTELITPGGHVAPASAVPASLREGGTPSRDTLTRELVAEVVNTVHARLAQDLERRVAQQVTTEVQAAVAAVLGDLRQDIADAVGDAVAEALARRPIR
jgi:hypothetical protein